MSRTVVCASAFLLVISLSLAGTKAIDGDPPKQPPGSDDPFSSGNASTEDDYPIGDAKPAAKRPAKAVAPAAEAPAAKAAGPDGKATTSKPSFNMCGGEKAIVEALRQKVSLDFADTPLRDVLDGLSYKYRIPILIDAAGLKDANVDPSQSVTIKVSGISLQSALEIMLDELQLKWTMHHEVLTITSPTKAESDEYMETKIYDVSDLVLPPPAATISNPLTDAASVVSDPTAVSAEQYMGGQTGLAFPGGQGGSGYLRRGAIGSYAFTSGAVRADFSSLMDLIQNTVATKSWIDNGGNGTISEFPTSCCLVLSQTQEVHREVQRLLAKLRSQQCAAPEFHIELQWLWLDAAHRDLLFNGSSQSAAQASRSISPQRLSDVTRAVPCFHALANCLNGQDATVAAGDRRAQIINAVVSDKGGTAYQPIVSMPNVGIAATVMPILLPGTKTVRLTIESRITRWTPARPPAVVAAAWGPGKRVDVEAGQRPSNGASQPSEAVEPLQSSPSGGGFMAVGSEDVKTAPAAPSTAPPAAGTPQGKATQPPTASAPTAGLATAHASVSSHGAGSTSCPVDLPVMPTQEFGTTLRVPLGKPVVVGSVTFAPAGDAGVGAAAKDPVEVYLIATVSVVKKAKK